MARFFVKYSFELSDETPVTGVEILSSEDLKFLDRQISEFGERKISVQGYDTYVLASEIDYSYDHVSDEEEEVLRKFGLDSFGDVSSILEKLRNFE